MGMHGLSVGVRSCGGFHERPARHASQTSLPQQVRTTMWPSVTDAALVRPLPSLPAMAGNTPAEGGMAFSGG